MLIYGFNLKKVKLSKNSIVTFHNEENIYVMAKAFVQLMVCSTISILWGGKRCVVT